MTEAYYDNDLNLFAIDVYIDGFDGIECSGISLEINYNNEEFIIDEDATEATAYSGLENINAENFDFSSELIEVKGIQPPLESGPQFTGSSHQLLFTIYFTATARACSYFTFGDKRMVVSFPPLDYEICTGDIGNDCEPGEVCLVGFTLGGLIESPVIDCDGAYNGGIPGVEVFISELEEVEIFGCETETDDYGDYECDVVADLDYRVTPKHDYNYTCGISSLDLDILQDHILTTDCLEYLWQWFAGDMNGNDELSTLDLVEIQKAILEYPVDWSSWQFVPASIYNETEAPECYSEYHHDVPPYDPYIVVEDVDEDIPDLDFVGIKMGDLNGTCTECSSFTSDEEILTRTPPVYINLTTESSGAYSLAFDSDVEGLEVFYLAIYFNQEPEVTSLALINSDNFITRYADGIFYISYVSFQPEGESFVKGQPILILNGNFNSISQGSTQIQNEIIYGDIYSRLNLKVKAIPQDLIYPNPTHNSLCIELASANDLGDCTISIYDLFGNLVFSQKLSSRASHIDFELIANVYVYEIQKGTASTFGKLIVQ